MALRYRLSSIPLASMFILLSTVRAQEDESSHVSSEAPYTYGENGEDVSYEVRTVMVRVRMASPGDALHLFVRRELLEERNPVSFEPLSPVRLSDVGARNARTPLERLPPLITLSSRLITVRLCDRECFVALGAGLTYRLIVFRHQGRTYKPSERPRSVRITERTIGLDVGIENRRAHRIRRTILVASIAALGGALMGLSYKLDDRWCEDRPDSCDASHRNQGLFWSGFTLAISPAVTFILPWQTGDRTYVRVIESDTVPGASRGDGIQP